jgi:hypothetical protein
MPVIPAMWEAISRRIIVLRLALGKKMQDAL